MTNPLFACVDPNPPKTYVDATQVISITELDPNLTEDNFRTEILLYTLEQPISIFSKVTIDTVIQILNEALDSPAT